MSKGRLWGLDPGVDFPEAFAAGLLQRFATGAPEDFARLRVYLNTGRMLRRVREALSRGPARLLPRLSLITDLGRDVALGPVPPARSALRQRLELAQLVAALIDAEPELAPRDSAFDLAASLTTLLAEMQGEGVAFEHIARLDVADQSGHWARSQRFLALLSTYLLQTGAPPDIEGRQRRAVEALAQRWQAEPPKDPIVIAGSTGSRGTTRLFMETVLGLPNGHVVLPGFDFDLPSTAWAPLTAPEPQEDHPQFRFADLMSATGFAPNEIARWADAPAPRPSCNALVSLALRPAPVTDCWQTLGPQLGPLADATAGLSLIEAPDPRLEAVALALVLRKAAEDGKRVALITPDRTLTRQVAAALNRWDIEPDDSAGEPLIQSPTGRLLRQIAAFWTAPQDAGQLIALLSHPLVHRIKDRNQHLLFVRDYELWQRRAGPAFPNGDTFRSWAARHAPQAADWAKWFGNIIDSLAPRPGAAPLPLHVNALLDAQRRLVTGAAAEASDSPITASLWPGKDGRDAHRKLTALATEAEAGGVATGRDFAALLRGVLAGEVRDPDSPHPGVMIWGTLEARVQGAEIVLLAGLNEGIWPAAPDPDPWLNRRMRKEAGLLSPDRQIGLAAHDFQQAIAGAEVVLSRAVRDNEAPTVPSRWLNRLTTLIGGLPALGGPEALAAMRARGRHWTALAQDLDRPENHGIALPRAPRPSPKPPAGTAPERLSVSDVETLLRDPFAIYAKRLLRLTPLDPLQPGADPALRGTVLHRALERAGPQLATLSPQDLMTVAEDVLSQTVPWAHIRALWRARLARTADWFLDGEHDRQTGINASFFEASGELALGSTGVLLTSKADRADLRQDGRLNLYDYKTGAPPTEKQQGTFSKQLLLVAAIAEAGGFEGIPATPVAQAAFIGLGTKPALVAAPLAGHPPSETLDRVVALLAGHIAGQHGYTARRAMEMDAWGGDFDQLARFGEWDATEDALVFPVGGDRDG